MIFQFFQKSRDELNILDKSKGVCALASMLEQIQETLRVEGIRGLWFKGIGVLFYRRVYLLERSLLEPINVIEARLPVEYVILSPSQMDDYIAFRNSVPHYRIPEELIRRRFDSGHLCFAAIHNNEIACANWAATTAARSLYLDMDVPIGEKTCYLYDTFTGPRFRRRGLMQSVGTEILRHFRDTGFRSAIRMTLPENIRSLKASYKIGFKPVALIGRYKIGPKKIEFRKQIKSNMI